MNVLLLRTFKGISLFKEKKKIHPPFAPPLSLLYIASSIEEKGHKANLIDMSCETLPEDKIKKKLATYDLVIINILPGNQIASSSLTQFIKEHNPTIPIIIEGLYCTIDSMRAMKEIPLADICIRGEGELIINNIIDSIKNQKTFEDIPGVYYRKNNHIKSGKPSKSIEDLDSIPYPARHLIQSYDYGTLKGIHLCKPQFTSMITSRGCPFHCYFCNSHYINAHYRQRSANNVISELKVINESYRSLMIEDDNFLANKKRAHIIFDGILEEGIDLEIFIAGARVDSADTSLYKKMAKSGVKFISYGIESGNKEILKYYNKHINLNQVKKTINLANKMGIITWGNFIFGAPVETKNHLKETLDFSLSLPLDMAFYRHFSYQRGADAWNEAVSKNLIDKDASFILAGSGKTTTHLTKEEIAAFSSLAFKRFYYRPTYLFREILRSVKRKDLTILRSLYAAL